jgi:hypothetical protein
LLEERIHEIADPLSEGYRRSLLEKWKDDIGHPPDLRTFCLGFIFKIHNLIQWPIWVLVGEVHFETALKAFRKVLDPEIKRYQRLLQQAKNDSVLCSFVTGALALLKNCAPKSTAVRRNRSKYGIHRPLTSSPHRQQIFDKMLVQLTDYLRDTILIEKESDLFKHVAKILSLAWGAEICPNKPKMWQQRYRREKA